jgi:hypothetical protein
MAPTTAGRVDTPFEHFSVGLGMQTPPRILPRGFVGKIRADAAPYLNPSTQPIVDELHRQL